MSRWALFTNRRSRRCLIRRGRVWQTNTRRGGMIAIVSATRLDQSILAIWCWSTPKAMMDALKATRYCFASVNHWTNAEKGESLFGSFSFLAGGDPGCGVFLLFSRPGLRKQALFALGET